MKNNKNMASYIITISLIFSLIIYTCSAIDNEYNTARVPRAVSNRQNAVPVLYVEGTHYEVGFMVGITFGKIIQDYIEACGPLNEYLENVYETSEGKKIYNENLEAVEKIFPQYLLEIKGMATGANVSFHKLFMIHLDGMVDLSNVEDKSAGGTGCSTLIVNMPNSKQFRFNSASLPHVIVYTHVLQLIGHNEDAMRESLNRFYVINAHVVPGPNEGGGQFTAREERWEALTYAASLPGYASGHNHHGLLFTINTIFGKNVMRNRIPRAFLTRALLASRADVTEIEEVLTNRGFGTADAFHVNVGLLRDDAGDQKFYSVEVTPSGTALRSNVVIEPIEPNTTSFRVNRLLSSPDFEESDLSFSIAREERYKQLTKNKPVESLNDILQVLGDTGDGQIFIDGENEFAQTINTGVFDCINKMWLLWTKNPKTNAPVVMLPLKFPDRIIPSLLEETSSKAN